MSVKLLTEDYLEFLSSKGGCTGSSESTHVKMPHCWKSHVTAQIIKFPLLLKFHSLVSQNAVCSPKLWHAEYFNALLSFSIVIEISCKIQVVCMYLQAKWKTVDPIRWLADLFKKD